VKEPSKSLGHRLLAGTLNYGLGQVLSPALSFMLLPLFAAHMTPDDYGVLEVATSLGGVLAILMRVGLPGATTRFYFEYRDDVATLRDFLTTLVWVIMFSSLVVAAVSWVALWLVGPWLTPGLALLPHTALVLLSSLLAGNSDIQRRLIQAREDSGRSLRLSLVTSVVTLGSSVVLVVGFGLGVVGFLMANAISGSVLFLLAVNYLKPDLRGRFRPALLKGPLIYALSALPSQGVATCAALLSRSILATSASIAAVGLYGLASRFTRPLSILTGAFSTAYLPLYFEQRRSGTPESQQRLTNVVELTWQASLLASLAISLLGPPAVRLLTPDRFHVAASLIPLLALGFQGQVLYVLTSAELFYAKVTPMVAITSFVGSGVLVACTAWWAKPLGGMGLTLAYVAYEWTLAAMACGYQATRGHVSIPWRAQLVPTALCGFAFALSYIAAPAANGAAIGLGLVTIAAFAGLLHFTGSPLTRLSLLRRGR
jgi:O-antigen/teichoic acid export membrane protein